MGSCASVVGKGRNQARVLGREVGFIECQTASRIGFEDVPFYPSSLPLPPLAAFQSAFPWWGSPQSKAKPLFRRSVMELHSVWTGLPLWLQGRQAGRQARVPGRVGVFCNAVTSYTALCFCLPSHVAKSDSNKTNPGITTPWRSLFSLFLVVTHPVMRCQQFNCCGTDPFECLVEAT